jgi:EAL domain-containing protein (putative c-di-GMP-specific phosphodiesterase class I)
MCDSNGKFTHGIGNLLYEMHPNFLELTCWDAHKDDPLGAEHYRACLEYRIPQVFNIQHSGRLFSVVMEPRHDGGLQGIAVLAVDRAEIGRMLVQSSIQDAINNHELEIWLQPIVYLVSGETIGHEALLRWRTADNHIVSPDVFLPMANGLMPDICIRVLELCADILHKWRKKPSNADLWLAMNIAPSSISEEFLDRFNETIERLDVDRKMLHLEITESFANEDAISWFVAIAKRLGHKIKIDDYGVSGSDDIRLVSLPIDDVKFDMLFISQVVNAAGRVSTGKAIAFMNRVNLCRKFKIGIIVEGIEHESQREWLISQGIEYGQGYLFSKPVPADTI